MPLHNKEIILEIQYPIAPSFDCLFDDPLTVHNGAKFLKKKGQRSAFQHEIAFSFIHSFILLITYCGQMAKLHIIYKYNLPIKTFIYSDTSKLNGYQKLQINTYICIQMKNCK